jgi:geranylgeranyl diphosphate synthase, type I
MDALPQWFPPLKAAIADELAGFLAEARTGLAAVNPLGPDLCGRLLDFTLPGKMIRGCLVSLGHRLGDPERQRQEATCVRAGAAMELFQSGLLVHDDIMDRDLTRRGRASLFHRYGEEAALRGHADARHEGESLGICAGDVAYFLAFELLARVEAPPRVLGEAVRLCARELASVGVAQMQDVSWDGWPGEEEILRMYRYKTARYSFSLPLALGAVLAEAAPESLAELESLGQDMGALFQIRDDELGLFGTEAETGKPVGSDVREGKKTLHHACLMAAAGPRDAERLRGIFGSPECTEGDVALVRELVESLGVRARIAGLVRGLEARARAGIERITSAREEDRLDLEALLGYTMARSR